LHDLHVPIPNTATAEKQRVSCACMRSWRAVSLR